MTRRTRKATPNGYKHCNTCDKILPIDDFGWRNKANDKRRHHCNNCRNLARWIMRRVKYEYGQLLEKQNHKCAICDVANTQSRLSIDHNHKTQEIRGLLCHDCNSGIASFLTASIGVYHSSLLTFFVTPFIRFICPLMPN